MLQPVFFPFPEIRTQRLLLRRLEKTDALEILSMRSDESVMKYIGKEPLKTLEEAEAWIQVVQELLDTNEGITWAISFLDEPAVLIGTMGLWRMIKQHHRAEVGYMLHSAHWNKGIAKEALQAIIKYGFEIINLHSIEAHINPDNIASASILEKTGFIREAYFKENFCFRDQFTDSAVYSLLAK